MRDDSLEVSRRFEALKVKTNATTATLLVSTDVFTLALKQFRNGTGFALNQLSVCFSKTHAVKNRPDGNRLIRCKRMNTVVEY
jgi:hypothetical protein